MKGGMDSKTAVKPNGHIVPALEILLAHACSVSRTSIATFYDHTHDGNPGITESYQQSI